MTAAPTEASALYARVMRVPAVVRYLVLGAFAAGVNFLSRFGWELIMPFAAAVVAAYATGMVVAFVLFRTFVFPESPTPVRRQIRNFVLVNILGLAQTWAIAVVLADRVLPALHWTFQPQAIAHAVAITAPTITSWFGHRYLTFAKHAD